MSSTILEQDPFTEKFYLRTQQPVERTVAPKDLPAAYLEKDVKGTWITVFIPAENAGALVS